MTLSFRNRDEISYSLVNLLSIAILGGCLAFMVLAKKPDTKALATRQGKDAATLQRDIRTYDTQLKQVNADIDKRLWAMKAEEIGPAALSKVNAIAKAHHIKLQAFRPQRIVTGAQLEQVPFQISMDGRYSDVIQFAHDLESSKFNLAVNLIQMSAGDGNTDAVSAIVGIVAFRRSEEAASG